MKREPRTYKTCQHFDSDFLKTTRSPLSKAEPGPYSLLGGLHLEHPVGAGVMRPNRTASPNLIGAWGYRTQTRSPRHYKACPAAYTKLLTTNTEETGPSLHRQIILIFSSSCKAQIPLLHKTALMRPSLPVRVCHSLSDAEGHRQNGPSMFQILGIQEL